MIDDKGGSMFLQRKTLEKLRNLINEETVYRSGPVLISFFNQLGFNDQYGRDFPSRWKYTDDKLGFINGKPELDQCIKNLFAPIDYIEKFPELDQHINAFNQYLAFDGWKVIRKNQEISFQRSSVNVDEEIRKSAANKDDELSENDFLKKEFEDIVLDSSIVPSSIVGVLQSRIAEMEVTLRNNAPLAVIFLAGSTLEGILLGVATLYPKQFNLAHSAPKEDNGKTKQFQKWTLNNFIEVAHELGYLKEDVKKFSHSLRDFRNYIHPYEQQMHSFLPDINTAKICFQVLKAAIEQIHTATKEES